MIAPLYPIEGGTISDIEQGEWHDINITKIECENRETDSRFVSFND